MQNADCLLFESLVLRDLRVYAGALDDEVYHYRDNTGLEVDAVVETAAGQWLAAQTKLGGDKAIDAAARNLLKLRARVDADAVGEPSETHRRHRHRQLLLRPSRRRSGRPQSPRSDPDKTRSASVASNLNSAQTGVHCVRHAAAPA